MHEAEAAHVAVPVAAPALERAWSGRAYEGGQGGELVPVQHGDTPEDMGGTARKSAGKGSVAYGSTLKEHGRSVGFGRGKLRRERICLRRAFHAGIKYARLLDIEEEEPMIYLRRLFLTNNEPYSIEETYIPYAVCPELEKLI